MSEKVGIAEEGVKTFHAELNAAQFDVILQKASLEYQKSVTLEQNRKLFNGIQKKLGSAGNWTVEGWSVNVTPLGAIVRLNCKTKFALGDAQETFVWKVNGHDASLMG